MSLVSVYHLATGLMRIAHIVMLGLQTATLAIDHDTNPVSNKLCPLKA